VSGAGDGRLRVNLNAFQMNVEDFQLPAGYADPVTNIINYLTRNFAGLENYGLEAEVTWAPAGRCCDRSKRKSARCGPSPLMRRSPSEP
jgi:hypothetical protein